MEGPPPVCVVPCSRDSKTIPGKIQVITGIGNRETGCQNHHGPIGWFCRKSFFLLPADTSRGKSHSLWIAFWFLGIPRETETRKKQMSDTLPLYSLPGGLDLTFYPGGNEDLSAEMEQWVHRIEAEYPGRLLGERKASGTRMPLPALSIRGGGRSEISYHFVPEGTEEEAFLDLLRWKGKRTTRAKTTEEEEEVPRDRIEFLLFVANQCPNCPRAVRAVHALAMDPENPDLDVHMFEATHSTDLAREHGIRSVPTLLIQKTFRFVGTPDPEKLSALLRSGNTGGLLLEQIRHQIREGEAPEAGRAIAMLENPTFLLQDIEASTFQERIGWLVALEEAMEDRSECLDPLVPGLVSLLERAETALRGDVADLLGRIGNAGALPGLERLRHDPNPDVAEAARDAIDQILEKSRGSPPPGTS
jgi:hypothetical protein